MLTRLYIEALLVDEELADQVWEAWDTGEISDFWAAWGWWMVATQRNQCSNHIRLGKSDSKRKADENGTGKYG